MDTWMMVFLEGPLCFQLVLIVQCCKCQQSVFVLHWFLLFLNRVFLTPAYLYQVVHQAAEKTEVSLFLP